MSGRKAKAARQAAGPYVKPRKKPTGRSGKAQPPQMLGVVDFLEFRSAADYVARILR